MAKVWSGDVDLEIDLPGQKLRGIQIYGGDSKNPIPTHASLSLIALLDVARVPLGLIAGPSLDVYTDHEETEQLLGKCLLGAPCNTDEEEGHNEGRIGGIGDGSQSDVGMLLRVERNYDEETGGPHITELLLYAALSPSITPAAGILTPPRSSSPSHEPYSDLQPQMARVHALPLTSDLRYTPPPSPQDALITPELIRTDSPTFLSPPDFASIDRDPRKRPRLDSLFDDATQQQKRSRHKGGKSISRIMANQTQTSATPKPEQPTEMLVRKRPKPVVTGAIQPLARSQSMGSMGELNDSRPSSRSGPIARTQRSSLHRVTSLSRLDSISPTQSPVPENVPWNETEQANKSALSRIVMAGMRMYGLQQKRKPTRERTLSECSAAHMNARQEGPSRGEKEKNEGEKTQEEDEYKLVYHQTYKAAAFTLRRQIRAEVLGQGIMRDAVDRLLAIFCVDPRESVGDAKGPVETPGAFDPPSSSACAQQHICIHAGEVV